MYVYQVILIVGLVQGVLLSVGLLLRNWGKKNQNYYFILLVVLITIALLAKLTYTPELFRRIPRFWFIPDTVAYLIGPLWYFTLKKSTTAKFQVARQEIYGLLPIIYHIASLVYFGVAFTKAEFLLFSETAQYFNLYIGFAISVIACNSFFLIKARWLLKKVKSNGLPTLLVKGQLVLLIVFIIWLISFALSFLGLVQVGLSIYNIAFATLAVVSFSIAFVVIVNPGAFYFLTQTYDSSELFALQELAKKIESFLQNSEAPYEQGFSLKALSESIGANQVLTSKAIHKVMQTSFSDLVNEYRVTKFLKMVKSGNYANYTYWAIAEEVGFGNKVTFYSSFKKFKGTTPKTYLKDQ